MVQSINTKALLTLASVVRRPYLASPHIHVPTISDVNYQSMRDNCGIKAIIFDKDNTITAPYDISIHERASLGISKALDVFGHDNVAILSNSAGTKDDKDYEDAIMIEKKLGINVIRHDEKKPGGLKEVLDHFKEQGIEDASELCMVGDRLLTDVVFGNLYGMLTVHCLPLCTGEENVKDNKIANVVRTIENKALYKEWWFGRTVRKNTIPHKVWEGDEKCPLILKIVEEKTGSDSDNDDAS
jgi:phosphatidylglycerophosphatase GEP4